MSAGISYMYKSSGGCEKEYKCEDCIHLKAHSEERGAYSCKAHPDSETEHAHIWKESYMACKKFENRKGSRMRTNAVRKANTGKHTKSRKAEPQRYQEAENGQLSFILS